MHTRIKTTQSIYCLFISPFKKKHATSKVALNILYNLLIISIILLAACKQTTSKDKVTVIVDYYPKTGDISQIVYLSNSGKTTDSIYYYHKNGQLDGREIWQNDSVVKTFFYENNKIESIVDHLTQKYFYYDKNGYKRRILDKKDSTVTVFYKNSNNIKTFEKYNCYNEFYYRNGYDSITNKINYCYRRAYTDLKVLKDSIYISLYFATKREKIENYTFILIEHEDDGTVRSTKTQKHIKPLFVYKTEKKKRWTMVVCDSLGCFSWQTNYINKD